jgi:CheY-like chemotaxis protein
MATVMVVDDTESSRQVVSRILKLDGHTPVCAANGAEALAILPYIKPDVVLLDIMMPVMDGLTFLEIVRQNPQWEALPVILMTGRSDAAAMNKAQELGAKEYLVKTTFSVKDILQHIKRYSQRQ